MPCYNTISVWFLHNSHMDWKPRNIGKHFQSGEIQGNTGKVREFYPKYWKRGILASFYFYLIFSDFLIEVYLYLLNLLNKTLKRYWKMKTKY